MRKLEAVSKSDLQRIKVDLKDWTFYDQLFRIEMCLLYLNIERTSVRGTIFIAKGEMS